jgi:transglycosylase-like protein with SLT domain
LAKITAGLMALVLVAALGLTPSAAGGQTGGGPADRHTTPAPAANPAQASAPPTYPDPTDLHTPPSYIDAEGNEVTDVQIRKFLAGRGSPMAPHATALIQAANRYDVDPRVVVAISGVESEFGIHCAGYNAWGWNGGRTRWRSWEESIDTYVRLLRSNYPNWRNIRRVAPRYNPNTPEAWSRKVAFLITSITEAPS